MAEYIDRMTVISAIRDYELHDCPEYMRNWATQLKEAVIADVINGVTEIPVVDVAPVKHGKWEYEHGAWQCSNCGEDNPYGIDYDTARFSKYCPNCGAKMDGEGYS